MSTRAAALLFAFIVVGVLLMPARYLFLLVGITLIGGGFYVIPGSSSKGALAIVVGVGFVALGLRTIIREHREAAADARKAREDAEGMTRRNRRPES